VLQDSSQRCHYNKTLILRGSYFSFDCLSDLADYLSLKNSSTLIAEKADEHFIDLSSQLQLLYNYMTLKTYHIKFLQIKISGIKVIIRENKHLWSM
jgi:hypothetical protein